MSLSVRKKLIEVALPLEAINAASAREKSIRHGHPSTLHLWWARRPLAAARAVIFSQMVDDPSSHPEKFPTEEEQNAERERLFDIIRELVKWENTTNEHVLNQARQEIWRSWRWTCEDNKDHPQAAELFNPDKLPAFHDPFAGGGVIPFEAQRLGLNVIGTDLNPVAVLINKALIELPALYSDLPPANPRAASNGFLDKKWRYAEGLADDVLYYGELLYEKAKERLSHLYPDFEITENDASYNPLLTPYIGQRLPAIAWIWARTVKSPNPAFSHVSVPLASSFILSGKGKEKVYIQPLIHHDSYTLTVKHGEPESETTATGTSAGKRKAFVCIMSGTPIPYTYIRNEAKAGRMGIIPMAVVLNAGRKRLYAGVQSNSALDLTDNPDLWKPENEMPLKHRNFQPPGYGMEKYGDLFTARQLLLLNTLSDLVQDFESHIKEDTELHTDIFPKNYSQAIIVYLAEIMSKLTAYHCSVGTWRAKEGKTARLFGRQAIPMVWDFPECNPFANAGGDWLSACQDSSKVLRSLRPAGTGRIMQMPAQISTSQISQNKVISTDPPYYDNVAYAELSDFYYPWLRRTLKHIWPDLFSTISVPKSEELVASRHRHGSEEEADAFFLQEMRNVMRGLTHSALSAYPVTIYYAFKQSEIKREGKNTSTSTAWEVFLDALVQSGLAVFGTWPIRTEQSEGLKANLNSLATSIVLVCRPRNVNAKMATRQQFRHALKAELPDALRHLQQGNIAPVDLAQSAIGPGMAVYTRYARVVDPSGNNITVRHALTLINEVLDETLAEQESDFDADTQWAIVWFDQHGYNEGSFGDADNLSRAKVTSVAGMMEAGILHSKGGKVRLLRPEELPDNWDPREDNRFTIWEAVHHMVKSLNDKGETGAAELLAKLGSTGDIARELAYRLYNLCERKKRSAEALNYNNLVQSWPEIVNIATANPLPEQPEQTQLQM